MKRGMLSLMFLAVFLVTWETAVRREWVSDYLIAAPSDVLMYLKKAALDGSLPQAAGVTMRRLVTGYVAGFLIGLPLGLLIARFKCMQDTIGLLALGMQALPSVCWAPLALLWFGQKEAAIFFIVIMGSVWSIALSVNAGVHHVPSIFIHAARTMGSKGLHTWIKVILPASLPFVVSGMKQGWAFAWRSLMAAEIYITIITGLGLGHLLHYGRELHRMDTVIGIMFLIIVIGLVTDRLMFLPLERFIHRRWGTLRDS